MNPPAKRLLAMAESGNMLWTMSVAELKKEVDGLPPRELAELSAYIAQRDHAEWNAEIDRDFSEGGRLRGVLEEVRADIGAGRLEEMP